ncbi:MAG TPA: hypothetical protein VEP90_22350, partial [Methylomirabilota bacterium]|nr:hypothetical protein [Methylomirabilota bacterium]
SGQGADSCTESLALTPTADETQIFAYEDQATEQLSFGILSSEIYGTFDEGTEVLLFTPIADEITQFADSNVIPLRNFPASDDIADFSDSKTEILLLSPSGSDIHVLPTDEYGELYLRLIPISHEVYKIVQLVGTVYRKWFARIEDLKYSGNIIRKWWSSD